MNELRWHPLLREWVAVAAHRQDRLQMPENWCPFDPGSGRVPGTFDALIYPNDFPAFRLDAEPFAPEPGLYAATGTPGVCDVVVYHPEQTLAPSQLSADHWRKVVDVWEAALHRAGRSAGHPVRVHFRKHRCGVKGLVSSSMDVEGRLRSLSLNYACQRKCALNWFQR